MVAARTAAKGLSTVDLEQIRDTLAAGRKPKVVFTEAAGQIAGQLGQVVALTDPELSDEFVVVRFGKDELPFSPADLAIAPKAAPQRRAAVPAPREESPVPALTTADATADTTAEAPAAPDSPTTAAPAGKGAAVPPGAPLLPEPAADKSAEAKPAKAAPAKKAAPKAKAPAGLTVTLAYADGEWTVAASQGAKALAKPYVIKPSEALKMVGMLDVPGVHDAVEEIVQAARAEAEAEAERLRSELAEIEARLAELRETE
ncbi:hypothetical protein KZZ52_29785 [Dactylosporangium sp. AC04546]|uniref:hypothetical protein n=1 Tax=Dactylosporangium sp. AC04546 TaxID=2862460 RepID=UPI001EDF54DB|nr:hypothetical protein [Dactylosporangium sp. AC04546]WVK78189.1 hypothetical protein KZZ52_29785 [Dactylosporangium sp. AC04546]